LAALDRKSNTDRFKADEVTHKPPHELAVPFSDVKFDSNGSAAELNYKLPKVTMQCPCGHLILADRRSKIICNKGYHTLNSSICPALLQKGGRCTQSLKKGESFCGRWHKNLQKQHDDAVTWAVADQIELSSKEVYCPCGLFVRFNRLANYICKKGEGILNPDVCPAIKKTGHGCTNFVVNIIASVNVNTRKL
jgi:hypothetical protein